MSSAHAHHRPIDVVLCWHMHQPWYLRDGTFTQPWVYLHGIKSYADMAAHLETVQGARAVVNFVPTLLDQLELYGTNIAAHLAVGAPLADPLLAALAADPLPGEPEVRQQLVRSCLMVNERHVLARHARFARLAEIARTVGAEGGRYLSDRFLADLLTWFHLAWFGEHRLRESEVLKALVERGGDFDLEDRRALLFLVGRELNGLVPRYRALAAAGRVELSVSPWAHPILPLLLDLQAGRDALPQLPLPGEAVYPGGEERVRWHLEHAIAAFRGHFGFEPAGCWPSEGAICEASVQAIGGAGFRWIASGGQVLSNSLERAGTAVPCRHRPFRLAGEGPFCFFRDDGLSDLIGFSYQHWQAADAVANLVGHIRAIAGHCDRPDALVAIVMDGENAWEHYAGNGYEFLQSLYRALAAQPDIRLTTFSEHVARADVQAERLPTLVAGSWVHGTLATWIGNAAKNRAWELLCAAKAAWDWRVADGWRPDAAAERELALCEGSDWFWWLDDFNQAETVARFEGLFRSHLRALYRMLGLEVPAELAESLAQGSADGAVPVMRPADGGPPRG